MKTIDREGINHEKLIGKRIQGDNDKQNYLDMEVEAPTGGPLGMEPPHKKVDP